jgi:hypothetical protein
MGPGKESNISESPILTYKNVQGIKHLQRTIYNQE